MLKFLRLRRRLTADLAFGLVLLTLSLVMYFELPEFIKPEIAVLFVTSFIFLGIGIVFLFLMGYMNPKFASFLYICFFPITSIIFLFTNWLPGVLPELGNQISTFFAGILGYILIMIGYLFGQFYIYINEPSPQEVKMEKGPKD